MKLTNKVKLANKVKRTFKLISVGVICLATHKSSASEVIHGIVTSDGITTYCAPGVKRPITRQIKLTRHESSIPVDAKDQKKTIPTEAVKDFIEMNLPLILEVDSGDDE